MKNPLTQAFLFLLSGLCTSPVALADPRHVRLHNEYLADRILSNMDRNGKHVKTRVPKKNPLGEGVCQVGSLSNIN